MNGCMNCKYKERDFWKMPCAECSEDTSLPNWEPKETKDNDTKKRIE